MPKNFGFSGVHCGLLIFRFQHLVFGFAKNINGFSDLISDAVFGFSYSTYLGSDLSGNYAPPLISNRS